MSTASDTPLHSVPFAAVDVEVTGPIDAGGRIVEAAVVRTVGGRVVDAWSTIVRPDARVPAARLRRLANVEALYTAPPFSRVWERLLSMVQDAAIVGHNVAVDLQYIVREVGGYYRGAIEAPVVDTMRLARAVGRSDANTLSEACSAFGLTPAKTHTAEADALLTSELLTRIITSLRGTVETLGQLMALQGGGVPIPTYPPLEPVGPLAEAMRSGEPITFEWSLRGPGEEPSVHVVPVRLDVQGDVVFLVGQCEDGSERSFRLDRIDRFEIWT